MSIEIKQGFSRVFAVLAFSVVALTTTISQVSASVITANYLASYELVVEKDKPAVDVTLLLKNNFDAAIEWWEKALPTNKITLAIDVKLKNLGGDNIAGETQYDTIDAQGFVNKSTIWFNNNTAKWFLDPTPHDDSEFTMTTSTLNQNNTTTKKVNSGRYSTSSTIGDNWDFLAVAKHEIAHALGIGLNNKDPAKFVLFENEVMADNDIDIDAAFAVLFPENILPVTKIDFSSPPIDGIVKADSHINGTVNGGVFNNTLMANPGFKRGMRALQSDLDILAIGSVYNLAANDIRLNPSHVPEPSALILFMSGTLALIAFMRRRQQVASSPDGACGIRDKREQQIHPLPKLHTGNFIYQPRIPQAPSGLPLKKNFID